MEGKDIKKFFDYILDKVEDCYKKEVEMAIKEFLKETALEVPVQEQHSISINQLRIQNGLNPISNGNADFLLVLKEKK